MKRAIKLCFSLHRYNKKAQHPVGLFYSTSFGITPVVPAIHCLSFIIFVVWNILFSMVLEYFSTDFEAIRGIPKFM